MSYLTEAYTSYSAASPSYSYSYSAYAYETPVADNYYTAESYAYS